MNEKKCNKSADWVDIGHYYFIKELKNCNNNRFGLGVSHMAVKYNNKY